MRYDSFRTGLLYLCIYALACTPVLAQPVSPLSAKQKTKVPGFSTQATQTLRVQPAQAGPMPPISLPTTRQHEQARLLELQASPEDGLPIFIRAEDALAGSRAFASDAEVSAAAVAFLDGVKGRMRIKAPDEEFVLRKIARDDLGHTHVRMAQVYRGIPVYASEIIVHFGADDELRFTGRYQPTPTLTQLSPTLDADAAAGIAIADVQRHGAHYELDARWKQIYQYDRPITALVIYRAPAVGSPQRLAWHVTARPNVLHRWEYFIDAHTGAVIHHYDHTCTVGPTTGNAQDLNGVTRTLNLFQAQAPDNRYFLLDASRPMYTGPTNSLPDNGKGFIYTGNFNNTNPNNPSITDITSATANNWNATAVSAHYNSGVSYEYFRSKYARNSINGQGGDIFAFINVSDDDGSGLDNAFWNGAAMFYGNGKDAFFPLAASLDVGGHEMSHGVIQETANLEYQGQSGALNESFADIFGVMIDRDDWLLGEGVVKPAYFPSGALRSMSDPNQGGNSLNDPGWQPKHMNQLYTGTEDNGGVHINSGINNYAFYRFVQGLGGNEAAKQKAEKIYYRALAEYLTRSSQFVDCRIAVIQAAKDLHGNNAPEVQQAGLAYDQVGILGGGGGTGPSDVPQNPGQDFIVSTNTDFFSLTTLQVSNTAGGNLVELSQTGVKTKISVTDDGKYGVFVGDDDHIYYISMNPAAKSEIRLSQVAEWDNVAISKDGSKVAAVSTYADTSIYVFNLDNGQGVRYILYNPTTAQGGISAGGVLYADALAWDHSGEFVMYDAFNKIPNASTGFDIEYWDVNFLRAWNNSANTFSDGNISKLFTNLPEGISVGNAVFSMNSPYIIAFDIIDNNAGTSTVAAANIETGDVKDVFAQYVLGYPSYARLDDKIIFTAKDQSDNDLIGVQTLASDKISPSGSAAGLISDAVWAVWYATGQRVLSSIDEGLLAATEVYPNPCQDRISASLHLDKATEVSLSVHDLMGRELFRQGGQTLAPGAHRCELRTTALVPGVYLLQVQAGETQRSFRFIKE
ncbi:MAG: hypothetical protein OHK0039_15420 [Bacteroidia bacterium]